MYYGGCIKYPYRKMDSPFPPGDPENAVLSLEKWLKRYNIIRTFAEFKDEMRIFSESGPHPLIH